MLVLGELFETSFSGSLGPWLEAKEILFDSVEDLAVLGLLKARISSFAELQVGPVFTAKGRIRPFLGNLGRFWPVFGSQRQNF